MNYGTYDTTTNTCKCYYSTSGTQCQNLVSCAFIKALHPNDPASCGSFNNPDNFVKVYCPIKFRCNVIG